MYNKKMLSEINLGKEKKATPYKNDMIVDPRGQWKYPGENTRIPGNNITMQGVNYPVLGVGSDGQKQMMYPGQDYQFPGASYVDEYPQMRRGGILPKAQYGKSYGCKPGTQWNPMTKTCVPIPRPTIVDSYDDPRYQKFLEQENLYNYSLLDNFNQREDINPEDALYGDFSEWDRNRGLHQKYIPGEEMPYFWDDDDSTGPYGSATIENYIPTNQVRRFINNPNFRYDAGAGAWDYGDGKAIIKKYPPAGYHTYDEYAQVPFSNTYEHGRTKRYGSNNYWQKPETAFIEDEVDREALKKAYPLMTDADIDKHIAEVRTYPSYITNYYDSYGGYEYGHRSENEIQKTEDGLHPKTYQITQAEARDPDNYYSPGMGARKAYLQESEVEDIYRRGQYIPVWGPPKEYFDWIPKLPIIPIPEPVYEDEIIPTNYNWIPPKKDPVVVVDNYEEELHTKKMPIIEKQPIYKTDANGMMYISGYKEVILGYEDIQGRGAGQKVEPTTHQLNTGNSYKKGGGIKTKKYSRSLESTNKLFSENSLLKKLKSRKKKIYDPKAKYYQEGGAPYNYNPFVSNEPEVEETPMQFNPIRTENDPEDYQQFLDYSNTAPENRRPTEGYTYGNSNDYDHYGMWDALGKPKDFNQALEMNPDWTPDPYDGYYHGFSVNPNTGVFLKAGKPERKPGDTTWMEIAGHYLSPRADMDTPVFDPEIGRFKYVPNENYIETELTPEEIEQYQKGGYIVEDISTPKLNQAQTGGRTYDGYDPEYDPYGGAPLTDREKMSCFKPPVAEDFDDGVIPYYILKRYEDWYRKNGYEIKPPMRPEVVMTPRPIDRSSLEPQYAEQEPTWNFRAPEIDLPINVREDHWGEQVGTTKQPIFETKVVPTMGADGIYRNVYKKVIVGYQDVQGMQYHNEQPTFHNLETGSSSGYQKGGAKKRKAIGISDPAEYEFRKAAYDDSLWMYNNNLEPLPKNRIQRYDDGLKLKQFKHKDSTKILKDRATKIYNESFAKNIQRSSPYYKDYVYKNHVDPRYRDLPENLPVKLDSREYYHDQHAIENPFTGTVYGVTAPWEDYIVMGSSRARYKKPVQPVYFEEKGKDKDKDKDKSKDKSKSKNKSKDKNNSKGNPDWEKDYAKKYPPIYLTDPNDPRIGMYTKEGNQYLYRPTNVVKEKVVLEPEVNIEDVRLPILPPKVIETNYPNEIIQRPSSLYPKQEGDIVPPQSKEIWVKGIDGQPYRIERPVDPRLTKPVKPGFYKRGGNLLTKKVTCKNCGWKWDADDGGNDITTCHKCGGQGLVHAQRGITVSSLNDPRLLAYNDSLQIFNTSNKGLNTIARGAYPEDVYGNFIHTFKRDNSTSDDDYIGPRSRIRMEPSGYGGGEYAFPMFDKPKVKVTYQEPIPELKVRPLDSGIPASANEITPLNLGMPVNKPTTIEAEDISTKMPIYETVPVYGYRPDGSAYIKEYKKVIVGYENIGGKNYKKVPLDLKPYQKGGMTMGQEVDLTPAQEAHLRKLGYKLERI